MSVTRCDSLHLLDSDKPTPTTHHSNVRDAVTKGPVQPMTKIAALHTFGENLDHDILLRNFTRIAEPSVPCRIRVDQGEWLPPTTADEHGFRLYVTYNHLMFAPQLRLECCFLDPTNRNATLGPMVTLEFPLSSANDKSIQGYNKTGDVLPNITFSARGATPAGFANIHASRFHLQRPERKILAYLNALSSGDPIHVALELDLTVLSRGQRNDLADIDKVLPGGSGPLLPSLSRPEYFAIDNGFSFSMDEDDLKNPLRLMESEVPFPMIPLAPLESFCSTKQAAIHLGYPAWSAELEVRHSVRAWAASVHKAVFFRLEHVVVPVLAVRFDPNFVRLGGLREELKFRLPRELQTRGTFTADEDKDEDERLVLSLVLDEISGLPPSDAAFLVLNRRGFAAIRDAKKQIYRGDDPFPEFLDIKFQPNTRSPTLDHFLKTCGELHSDAHSWVPHLLNQDTSCLEEVDLTRDAVLRNVQEADKWLFAWKVWNEEQKQLLRCIHKAKGSMVIVRGPAGTGKSLLQAAISLYFAKLGYKVLVCPPANSNASHAATEINLACSQDSGPSESVVASSESAGPLSLEHFNNASTITSCDADEDLPTRAAADGRSQTSNNIEFRGRVTPREASPTARRLFASSLTQTLVEMLQAEARHGSDALMAESSLSFLLQGLKDRKAGSRDFSVEQTVIDEAERGRYKMFGEDECGDIKPENDVWDILRRNLQVARNGTFPWSDKKKMEDFATAYDLCRKHVIAASDILIGTSGNARSSEIFNDWITSEEKFGIPSKGVILLTDEAFKDSELGTWNAIMAAGKKTKGVFMFGDEFQLKPTNTTSKGKLVFGQFTEQLDISLPTRLLNNGFPYVYLKEQQRMHPCLSKFPNQEFYAGKLRDGPRVHRTLNEAMPGLADVLHGIIMKSYSTYDSNLSAQHYWSNRTDEKARHHYIEVEGQRRTGHDGTSKYVQEHIDVFFKYVFPALQAYFGDTTSKNMMIVCAYTAAKVRYRAEIERLQNEQRRLASFYPSIEELVPDSEAASSGSSNSGTATPVTSASSTRNLESSYSRYLTIDAAQGQESFFVWMDGSFQHRDDIGFLTDRGRCNVAMTRAKGCFWMVGGALDCKHESNMYKALSPFPKCKQEMAREGKVHRISL